MGWKYDKKSLRKIYDEEKPNMTFGEFKKWAEHFANSMIQKAKKEMEDEEAVEQ